jgi:GNAT superfamily N-acetyltransferase
MKQAPVVETWPPDHPRWAELTDFIARQGQTNWVGFSAPWHCSSHLLVALGEGKQITGFLRYVIQAIGADEERPAVELHGEPLLEAKVLAFAVDETHRRQGIGRALQIALLQQAKAQGLYQVRSHSSGSNQANHQLKLALGYGVHPIVRGQDDRGAYFILSLHADLPRLLQSESPPANIHALSGGLTLHRHEQADPDFRRILQGQLNGYNETAVGLPPLESTPLVLKLYDADQQTIGGLIALTFWGWLRIDLLVVDERVRGRGLGRQLLYWAEDEARRRGCTQAHTSTYGFQALGFYQHLGYTVVGELADYPTGQTLYWLRKLL